MSDIDQAAILAAFEQHEGWISASQIGQTVKRPSGVVLPILVRLTTVGSSSLRSSRSRPSRAFRTGSTGSCREADRFLADD